MVVDHLNLRLQAHVQLVDVVAEDAVLDQSLKRLESVERIAILWKNLIHLFRQNWNLRKSHVQPFHVEQKLAFLELKAEDLFN